MKLDVVLLNSYQRKYFLSADGAFRVTIDSQMQFYRLLAHGNHFVYQRNDHHHTIVELKYNKAGDELAEKMTQSFPFRITRNSKYVEGFNRLHG